KPGLWMDFTMSAIRAAGFGVGAAYLFGPRFGLLFGALSAVGQTIAYRFRIRPTLDYRQAPRPRITKLQLWAALNRTVGYTAAGYLSSLVSQRQQHAIAIGLQAGLAIGLVTATAMTLTPFIEWTADHLPERRMGVLGIGLILIGFALQSVQYWLALLDL